MLYTCSEGIRSYFGLNTDNQPSFNLISNAYNYNKK